MQNSQRSLHEPDKTGGIGCTNGWHGPKSWGYRGIVCNPKNFLLYVCTVFYTKRLKCTESETFGAIYVALIKQSMLLLCYRSSSVHI
jgi:hypothetical protein